MIGKIIIGKGFNGAIEYLTNKDKRPNVLLAQGVNAFDMQEAKKDFYTQSLLNKKITKNYLHIPLSFHPENRQRFEELKTEILDQYIDRMSELGYDLRNTQLLAIEHKDTRHPHIHLVVNRVGNNGKAVEDGNIALSSKKVCTALTQQYNLSLGIVKKTVVNYEKLKGKDKLKYEIKEILNERKSINIKQFKHELKEKNINLIYTYNSNGIVGGFYQKNSDGKNICLKISSVEVAYTLKNIVSKLKKTYSSHSLNPVKNPALKESIYKLSEYKDLFNLITLGLGEKKKYSKEFKSYKPTLEDTLKISKLVKETLTKSSNIKDLKEKLAVKKAQIFIIPDDKEFAIKIENNIYDNKSLNISFEEIKKLYQQNISQSSESQELQKIILDKLYQSVSLEDFRKKLLDSQIELKLKFDSHQNLVGTNYIKDSISIKGSQINLTAKKLVQFFEDKNPRKANNKLKL